MNITSVLKLATAFVVFSISAHAAEVFYVKTLTTTYPVTPAADFNAVDADGNFTNPYNIYGTTDVGNASGVVVINNFNGDSSVFNTGYQGIVTNNNVDPPVVTNATTYFGPKFYAGINRQGYQTQGGAHHSNGNGYRIRANSVTAAQIGTAQVGTAQVGTAPVAQIGTPAVGDPGDDDYVPASEDYAPAVPASEDYVPASEDYAPATGNGGNPLNTKAIFLFDADTSSLSGEGDNLIFNDTDTIIGKLSVAGTLGANWTGSGTANRASLATYRAVIKAKGPSDSTGQYYAGSLYNVDLAETPGVSTLYTITEAGADAIWTLMPNVEVDSGNALGQTNLTVDTSTSATTVPGKYLTHITQVGFLLETDTNENTGGYNFGVREFTANASPASEPHPIEWSEDFTSPINGTGNFLTYASSKLYDGAVDPANLLTGTSHAYKWAMNGAGLTATPVPSTVTQESDKLVLDVKSQGPNGEVNIRMVGPGTDNARRVKPVSHEVTFEIDLIEWRDGQADLLLQTRGHDGYVRSVLSPSGNVKLSTWMSNYQHTNFDNFDGPSSLRNNVNNPGIVIVDGGTVDPTAGGVVTVDISGNAEGTVVLNAAGDAVESVTITNFGSGYIALPTLTWTGMSVDPTVSFNFETGNIGRQNVKVASMRDLDGDYILNDNSTVELPGTLLNDGQVLTYIQSYDNSDDSISYYYSLDGSAPQFITKLTAADHSPLGQGFFDVSTGNKWGQPNNQDAVWIQYKKWGDGGFPARLGINSVTVATSDDDRDTVVNRLDAFPNDPYETADSDSDSVGDNSDQYEGYNDGAVTTLASAISAAQALDGTGDAAGTNTFDYYVSGLGYSVGGGAITQETYDAVVAEKVAAETAQATAEANLATANTALATAQSALITAQTAQATAETALANAREARAGSTVIDVANDVATITLRVEQTSDVSDWSSATTSDHDIDLSAPAGASFYRFTIPE